MNKKGFRVHRYEFIIAFRAARSTPPLAAFLEKGGME